jgi:hypothetical protein
LKEENNGVFFFLSKIKEKKHRGKKKCRERREVTFPLLILHLG